MSETRTILPEPWKKTSVEKKLLKYIEENAFIFLFFSSLKTGFINAGNLSY